MEVDANISVEEDILSEYTLPSGIDLSELTTGLPQELDSEVPSQLTGEGAQSTLTSTIDYLNSALDIDLVSISGKFLRIFIIIFIT